MIGGDGIWGVGNHSMQTILKHSLALKIPGIVKNIWVREQKDEKCDENEVKSFVIIQYSND